MTTIAVNVLQYLVLVLSAPLLRALIARIKATIQRRQGSNLWRPYADLLKLFRKEDLVPPTASPLFRLAPTVLTVSTLVTAAMVPTVYQSALLGFAGDFIVLVYLLALGRFFMGLGALDGSSSFAGMGASREAMVSALAEAPLFLGLVAVAILAREGNIVEIARWTLTQNFFDVSAVHAVAFVALAIVAIAETGRMPVDNPTDPAMNLRSYYPDFIAMDEKGTRWILETKGAETGDVPYKDAAATQWCENATALTGKKWMYLKVQQKAFETLQPTKFAHLTALRNSAPILKVNV